MRLLQLLKESLLLENTLDKTITLGKEVVDKLRKMNPNLDAELNDSTYDYKNVYAKGGAARLALQLYVDMQNGTNTHKDDVVRDQDFALILDQEQKNLISDTKLKIDKNTDNKEALLYGLVYKLLPRKEVNNAFPYEIRTYYKNSANKSTDIIMFGERLDFDIIYGGMEEYFKSRDVTANQALLNRDTLIISRRALRDVKNKVVNPVGGLGDKGYTYYDQETADTKKVFDKSYDMSVNISPRLFFRMVLFAVRYNYKLPNNIMKALDQYKRSADFYSYVIPVIKAYELGIGDKYLDTIKEEKGIKRIFWILNTYIELNGGNGDNKSGAIISNFKKNKKTDVTVKNMRKVAAKTILGYKYSKRPAQFPHYMDPEKILNQIYKDYPEIKEDVDNLKFDIETKRLLKHYSDPEVYSKYLKKRNRQKL